MPFATIIAEDKTRGRGKSEKRGVGWQSRGTSRCKSGSISFCLDFFVTFFSLSRWISGARKKVRKEKNKRRFKKSGEVKINDHALVALALLVAQSNPDDKEIMIKLVINLIRS